MTLKEKIDAIRDENGIKLTDFAKEIGVPYRTVQNYVGGTTPPKAAFYEKVSEIFGVSLDWLLFDKGEMFAGPEKPNAGQDFPTFVPIPRFEVEASAGHGTEIDQETVHGVYAFNQSWLDRRSLKGDRLSVISVSGNSMEPDLYDRDLVLVDHASLDLTDSNIYAVRFSGALYVKRIQHQPGGKVLLISKNKDYPPIEISNPEADGVEVIGRIVASMHEW